MNAYFLNEKAKLSVADNNVSVAGSLLDYIYDPMLEMETEFTGNQVTIKGEFENVIAADALCIGNTSAFRYRFTTREGTVSGFIDTNGRITIYDFNETIFIDSFTLEIEGVEDLKLYLGNLYIGRKVVLPRFSPGSERGISLQNEKARSFGGQAFGMRRVTLESFGVSFPWLTYEEKELIGEYIKTVQNTEPHIIDPFCEARDKFPPVYVTLDTGKVQLKKINEDGFYYTGTLSWQEAR
jgi:hypothetical protein